MFTATRINDLLRPATLRLELPDAMISRVVIDSRQVTHGEPCIFVALAGKRTDGHRFVHEAWDHGVRNFIVERTVDLPSPANIFQVEDAVVALQAIARMHRRQYDIRCIGITGSNGKTWVKEWLYQLLHADYDIVKSPRSYNSQIGVPLSVLQIAEHHDLAIFEAGVSEEGDMLGIGDIIQPEIGILTHLGDAHAAGFPDKLSKLREKCRLFETAHTVVYPSDDAWLEDQMHAMLPGKRLIGWAEGDPARVAVQFEANQFGTLVHYRFEDAGDVVQIPFNDRASQRNAATCIAALLALGVGRETLKARMPALQPIEMRLEIHPLANQCLLVNDTYSLDLASLRIGLETLEQHSRGMRKALIISDIDQQQEHVYHKIAGLINQRGLSEVHAIGLDVSQLMQLLNGDVRFAQYADTEAFIAERPWANVRNTAYLLKGARRFGLERIAGYMQARSHTAVLEIDLNAMLHNLQYFNTKLQPETRIIAMVKAAAYGSGSVEVGKFLEFHNVNALAVAYIDEGVELRGAGVQIPIMVMNPDLHAAHLLLDHRLEPEIYDLGQLHVLAATAGERSKVLKVHLKVDTGMHRLGFSHRHLVELCRVLSQMPQVQVSSVFTHLAAAGVVDELTYSLEQIAKFDDFYRQLTGNLGIQPLRHVLNTRGILQFPELQFDAVRLGIGLYGVGVGEHATFLEPVHTLKARISQIHEVETGESVGYGRAFRAGSKTRIATVNAGYADGIMRAAGNGRYEVVVRGKRAPIIGTICMDMCMLDITGIPEAAPGDDVIIFGPGHSVEDLADASGTIPYEILTSISSRVPRIFRFA